MTAREIKLRTTNTPKSKARAKCSKAERGDSITRRHVEESKKTKNHRHYKEIQ